MNNDASLPVSSEPIVSELSGQACPECGGVMKIAHYGSLVEYTCHVGHRLGAKTMISQKSEVIERSLWNAVCQTEELLDLLQREKPQDSAAVAALSEEISQRREGAATLKAYCNKRELNHSLRDAWIAICRSHHLDAAIGKNSENVVPLELAR